MDVVQQLPAYPLPMSDYRYKLGFVRYPEWKYSCRKSSQFSLIETEKHLTLEDILETTNMCISLGSIFVIIAGVFLTIVFIFRKIYELYYRVQQKVLYDTLP